MERICDVARTANHRAQSGELKYKDKWSGGALSRCRCRSQRFERERQCTSQTYRERRLRQRDQREAEGQRCGCGGGGGCGCGGAERQRWVRRQREWRLRRQTWRMEQTWRLHRAHTGSGCCAKLEPQWKSDRERHKMKDSETTKSQKSDV